jgi:hypothetical protein
MPADAALFVERAEDLIVNWSEWFLADETLEDFDAKCRCSSQFDLIAGSFLRANTATASLYLQQAISLDARTDAYSIAALLG